jgi:hypothetical protein
MTDWRVIAEEAQAEAEKQRRIARRHERRKIGALKALSRVGEILDQALDEIEALENQSDNERQPK